MDHIIDPFGNLSFPVRAYQQVKAGFGAVGCAKLAYLIGALVINCVDPETVAKIRYLDDNGLLVQ